ncbi:wd repeat domain-containing protein [Rutstroemia sp. NJR-2017a BBW]|nr:wd repeat domain-containing protein [Rutstroemia sp. NJR-2017a BBW]
MPERPAKKRSPSVILPARRVSTVNAGYTQTHQESTQNETREGDSSFISPSPESLKNKFAAVLQNQVFIHITAAMERHQRIIADAKLKEIGKEVAGELIHEKVFDTICRSGDFLSPADEEMISIKARNYVDHFVGVALGLPPDIVERSMGKSHESDQPTVPSISAVGTNPLPVSERQAYSASPATTSRRDIIGTAKPQRVTRKARIQKVSAIRPPMQARRAASASTTSDPPAEETESIVGPQSAGVIHARKRKLARGDMNSDILSDVASDQDTLATEFININTPRPYLGSVARQSIQRGLERVSASNGRFLWDRQEKALHQGIYHIDFSYEELVYVRSFLSSLLPHSQKNLKLDLLIKKQKLKIPELAQQLSSIPPTPVNSVGGRLISTRGPNALTSFLEDGVADKLSSHPKTLRFDLNSNHPRPRRDFSSIIRQREVQGISPAGPRSGQKSYACEIHCMLEDELQSKLEWTGCCGDIWAVAWVDSDTFVCGATAHSDTHNMQYNRPGNLVVGSISKKALNAVPDHRIPRPLITASENVENSLDSMRQTQDHWLYTSVSAISHCKRSGYTFTASFDNNVKVWKASVSNLSPSISVEGTWEQEGKVNFVVTSEFHDFVATASDVYNNAVRVYRLDKANIDNSLFDTYNGEKAAEQAQQLGRSDNWAYYPATIQWGKAESVSHLLLVGYSPRARSGDEVDIPEEKRNSGELCLWNVRDRSRVPISSARTQNVFEVIWHPTLPCFLAATSPYGIFESETKTQVRIFARNDAGGFTPIRTFDCPACDINELTIMPNSLFQCYITASCTDGSTYVWDSGAAGDGAIHVLSHGESLDNPVHDLPREIADTGVKFAAWGKTSSRFYTGGSDGKVYAWDIQRPPGKALVRELLAASGGISAGVFFNDYSMLLIGDATGKVHILSRKEDDAELDDLEEASAQPGATKIRSQIYDKGPRMIKYHPDPPPPVEYKEENLETGVEISRELIRQGFISLHKNRAIGAVQGPNYSDLGLDCCYAHVDDDPSQPLLPYYEVRQQEHRKLNLNLEPELISRLPVVTSGSDLATHLQNLSLDIDLEVLDDSTSTSLVEDKVEVVGDFVFEHEVTPRYDIFKRFKGSRQSTRAGDSLDEQQE